MKEREEEGLDKQQALTLSIQISILQEHALVEEVFFAVLGPLEDQTMIIAVIRPLED